MLIGFTLGFLALAAISGSSTFVGGRSCRTIIDPAQRLECYDRTAEDLTRNEATGVPAALEANSSRARISHSKRLESRIFRVGRNSSGQWNLVLEDGSRWLQTDARRLGVDPAPGQTIVLRAGAMSSYFANITDQVAIKMRPIH